ncbi:hypothetical protein ENLAB_09100 [Enterococcus innesii]|uniref:Uncharacterized protein n=1 Tax=Enterococcus innesii TaxID=2839759 RepID=A0ABM7XQN0_9ENTE|nr:hypothetical protein ENLAB_09100 [Enterococcus innesii]
MLALNEEESLIDVLALVDSLILTESELLADMLSLVESLLLTLVLLL